jgi:hypothetical protein
MTERQKDLRLQIEKMIKTLLVVAAHDFLMMKVSVNVNSI